MHAVHADALGPHCLNEYLVSSLLSIALCLLLAGMLSDVAVMPCRCNQIKLMPCDSQNASHASSTAQHTSYSAASLRSSASFLGLANVSIRSWLLHPPALPPDHEPYAPHANLINFNSLFSRFWPGPCSSPSTPATNTRTATVYRTVPNPTTPEPSTSLHH
jgi:hypothetical protein